MQDIIYGIVSSVIDRDSFIINVTETSDSSQKNYNKSERIKIKSLDASDLGSLRGLRDKLNLERTIQGKKVRCSVQSRETSGRVVADVRVI